MVSILHALTSASYRQ